MNVQQMVSLMKTLGIGEVYSDPDSDRILLSFLNLAHDELYSLTSTLNDDLYIKETITSTPNSSKITLSRNPLIISKVWVKRKVLDGMSVDDFDDYTIQRDYAGNPDVYSCVGKEIEYYPILADTPYIFNVRHKPDRKVLEMNTPESEIPYPLSFHWVLVKGGLRYLFQDEAGFKNTVKENDAKVDWEKGVMNMLSYFSGRNKQAVSTYEEI